MFNSLLVDHFLKQLDTTHPIVKVKSFIGVRMMLETSVPPQFLCCIILIPPTQHLYLKDAGIWCLTITNNIRKRNWFTEN